MFKQVQYREGTFTAVDESGRNITIFESISFIFTVIVDEDNQRVTYKPVRYTNTSILKAIENFLIGKKYDEKIIDSIVIRFGWMDKHLNKLEFIGLTELMNMGKLMSLTQKRKVGAICKQLSMSTKNII